jgi:hypothetical protein
MIGKQSTLAPDFAALNPGYSAHFVTRIERSEIRGSPTKMPLNTPVQCLGFAAIALL